MVNANRATSHAIIAKRANMFPLCHKQALVNPQNAITGMLLSGFPHMIQSVCIMRHNGYGDPMIAETAGELSLVISHAIRIVYTYL